MLELMSQFILSKLILETVGSASSLQICDLYCQGGGKSHSSANLQINMYFVI